MNKQAKVDLWGRRFFLLLLIGSFLVNIKSIFMDHDIDVEYAVTMAYRLAAGERMFLDMWEPHQTSAFLCAIFIKIFDGLFHTTTGLVVYLNTCSFLLYGAGVYFFYRTIRDKVSSVVGYLIFLFLFTVRAKDIQILEFSNMQILFSIILLGCLIQYFDNQKKKYWLILAALSLCLEILSYPSCMMVFPIVLVIIWMYSTNRLKDIFVFGSTCAVVGGFYLSYFVIRIGFRELLEAFEHILVSDNYHTQTVGNAELYLPFFIQSMTWMLKCFCVSIPVALLLWQFVKRSKGRFCLKKSFFFLFVFCVIMAVSNVYMVVVLRDRFSYISSYLLILGISGVGG